MKKRLLYGICLTFLIVFCTGCSGNIKSEKEMLQDMTDEMKTIFITQDGGTQNIQLEPQSLKITKEDKNKETKDDTIYATIELKNDTYSFKGDYILYYHKYEKGGWILENYDLQDGKITALNVPSQQISSNEMSKYYFNSIKFKDSKFNEDQQEADFSYNVKYKGKNCSYDGIVVQKYQFESSKSEGTWDYDLDYQDQFNWDIAHKWTLDQNMYTHYGTTISTKLNINIKTYNKKTGKVTYEAQGLYYSLGGNPLKEYQENGSGTVKTKFNKNGEKEDDPVNLAKVVHKEKVHNYGTPVLYFQYKLNAENQWGTVNLLGDEAWIYGIGRNSDRYYGKLIKDAQKYPTGKTENTSTESSNTVETSDNNIENTDSQDMSDISDDNSADYNSISSTSDFKTVEADGYSFAYPKDFFESYENNGSYTFYASDGATLKVSCRSNQNTSKSESIKETYNEWDNRIQINSKILYQPSNGYMAIAGSNSGKTYCYYLYMKATDNKEYTLLWKYSYDKNESKELTNHKGYIIDCLYRFCSFKRKQVEPRSYEVFLKDA